MVLLSPFDFFGDLMASFPGASRFEEDMIRVFRVVAVLGRGGSFLSRVVDI